LSNDLQGLTLGDERGKTVACYWWWWCVLFVHPHIRLRDSTKRR